MSASAPKQIALRLPSELLAAVDKARGDVPRNTFIVRALEHTVSKKK